MEKNFNHRHPDYLRMCNRWKMAWDFWRGGIHVLNPEWEASEFQYGVLVSGEDDSSLTGEDSEPSRVESKYEWDTGAAKSYLWKHERESPRQYSARSAKLVHFPVFQYIINLFAAGVLKTGPKRGDGSPLAEPWDTYYKDVDFRGTDIDTFIRQALTLALVFGRCHALTDKPAFDEPAISRAEELARNERVYSYLVSPLDLTDWKLDEYGNFEWAVIREEMPDARQPGDEPSGTISQYRVWYPDAWELWIPKDDQEDSFEVDSGGIHSAGKVPLDTLWATKDGRAANFGIESPLADVLDIDRYGLNKLSEVTEIDRMQAFSLLWIPDDTGSGVGPIDVSLYSALTGSSETGTPKYISPDASLSAGVWARLQDTFMMIRQLASASRGKSEYSKEERSASALATESQDKLNQMSQYAASTEEFDNSIQKTVNSLMGRDVEDYPQTGYPKQFDIKSIMVAVQELVQLKSTDALPKKAMAEMIKPIAHRILRENGIPQDEIRKVEKEIEKAGEEKEPDPVFTSNNPFKKKEPTSNFPEKPDPIIQTD